MRRELDALLAMTIALGIFHRTEWQVDWRARKSLRALLSERHRVSWIGRFAGLLSSLSLVVYFCALVSGARL